MRSTVIFLTVFFLVGILSGQERLHQFHHLNKNNGLSAGTNNNFVFQDSRSNVWISSISGLHRYDGQRIRQYHQGNKPGDLIAEIASASNLFEDDQGRIWFTLGNAYSFYDYDADQFAHFTVTGQHGKVGSHYHWAWLDKRNQQFYFGAGDNLYSVHVDTPKDYRLVDSVRVNYKAKMYGLNNGEVRLLKILPGARSLRFSDYRDGIGTGKFGDYTLPDEAELNDAIGYGDHEVLVATDKGIYSLDLINGEWRFHPPEQGSNPGLCLELEIKGDSLIIGTALTGIYLFDLKRKKYTGLLYQSVPGGVEAFAPRLARLALDDRENLWISTLNDGVYYTSMNASKLGFKAAPAGTALPVVDLIMDEEGRLLTLYFDRYTVEAGGTVKSFFLPKGEKSELGEPTFLFKDLRGRLFLGTFDRLYVAEGIGQPFVPHHLVPGTPYRKSFGYNSMLQLEDGRFVLCINDSVPIVVTEDLRAAQDYLPGLHRPRKVVFGDSTTGLILTYIDSLHVFDRKTLTRDTFFTSQPLATDAVYDAETNRFWVTTLNGLYVLHKQEGRWILAPEPYMDSGNLMGIEAGDEGELWLSGAEGIQRFDTRQKELTVLALSDGIQGREFVLDASLRDDGGKFYFGGSNGVNVFHPRDASPSVPVPEIRAVNYLVNGEKVDVASLTNLPHHKNNLIIELANGDFSDPGQNKFFYRLDGAERVDTLQARSGELSFTNLAPAAYEIEIWSENADGVEDELHLFIPVIINPPWYRTWWAYTMVVLIGLFVIGAFLWSWYQKVRAEEKGRLDSAELRQQVAETETSVLRLQMNPHFIFNSLNSIDDYIMVEEDVLAAHDYLVVFAELMRKILDMSEQPLTRLDREVELLTGYVQAERMRVGEQLHFLVEQEEEVDMIFTWIPTMILQPFVENAIWHGIGDRAQGGTVTLRFKLNNDEQVLMVEIEDDGRGRGNAGKGTKQHSSKALSITLKRMELLNAKNLLAHQQSSAPAAAPPKARFEIEDLKHSDGTAAGTLVVLYLPLIYPDYDTSSGD